MLYVDVNASMQQVGDGNDGVGDGGGEIVAAIQYS